MSMFCYQCEQAAKGTGCDVMGVCGKSPTTARMQDLLVHACKSISCWAHAARQQGRSDHEVDRFVVEALFTTVTNVSFDPERIAERVRHGAEIRDRAKAMAGTDVSELPALAGWTCPGTTEEMLAQAETVGPDSRVARYGRDVGGLQELVLYGLKGTAAYADHAAILDVEDDEVYARFHETLATLAEEPTDVEQLKAITLQVGELNLRVMGMLDEANTGRYGHPEPTEVRVTPVKGKCIVVSGHDLKDLEELLKQTENAGINVYTHGEMLPCLAYPELKKYPHLVGNYGGAWQDQQREFADFPGAILMTTNCIQKPADSYKDRIFTCGLVAWPGVTHISDRDFSPVIEAARKAPGFAEDAPEKKITIGFARNTVMSVADKVIEAVKEGQIRHFFLVGGCDGAKTGRNYYTQFAEQVPDNCVILTLACGKFRFNKLEFGDIGGIPRLLDVGQCNDAYSAIQIAVALADAFDCGVNDLPLSLILSWYEQKAVCILLTLLHLGIQDMRIGPSLPAFIGPNVLQVLVDQFGLKPISTPQEDIEAVLSA